MAEKLAGKRSVFRYSGVTPFLGARLAATIAAQMQAVVVGWQVYDISHSPLALGFVGLAQFVPMALFILPAGDFADRFNRKHLLVMSWMLQALASILFVVLTLSHFPGLMPFYGVLVLFGLARAFSGSTMQPFLTQLVPVEDLARAIAWNSSAFQFAVIAGPALGGAAYILGPGVAYAICFALFLGAGLAVLTIRGERAQTRETSGHSAFARFTAGIAYVRDNPIILGAISLDLFAVLFGGATALLPVYASAILHIGPVGLGALRSAMAVGAFAVGLYLGRRSLARHTGMTMFACVALFGVATLVFGLSRSFALSFAALAVAGAADMVSVFVRATLVQLATPDQMRGRVSAVNSLFIGTSNQLGEFESGVTASWFGTVPAVVIGGLGTLAVVGLWMWRFPALRRVDRLADVRPAA
ncbi:MAG: MFS transporter [Gammaproteobacteria bacterium]